MQVSERRSCQLVAISRHGLRYESRRSDSALLEKLKAIAGEHPRYGYRRACALLRRNGDEINHKRVHRVWQEAKLSLPLRRPRKRRIGTSTMTCSQALRPNHVWTYDFVFDRCANGQQIKLLTVIHQRESGDPRRYFNQVARSHRSAFPIGSRAWSTPMLALRQWVGVRCHTS
jgi:putative transposase